MSELVDLGYRRTFSGQVDAETTMGPSIIKAELALKPVSTFTQGAVVHVIDVANRVLMHTDLSTLSVAVAIESGYGEWITGSLELIDIAYLNVPQGMRVARLEPIDADSASERTVHRVSLAALIRGAIFDRTLLWRLGALASPSQFDYALATRVSLRVPFDQELSVGAELVGGPAGSSGGFFASASRLYLEWRLLL